MDEVTLRPGMGNGGRGRQASGTAGEVKADGVAASGIRMPPGMRKENL